MCFFRKVDVGLVFALVVMVSVASNSSLAQTVEKQHGSFITINGGISGGHISTKSESNATTIPQAQTLGSINIGWFSYWQHFSADVQFTASPFVTSLSNQGNSLKAMGMQFGIGYSVFDTDILRLSPMLGFGIYRFQETVGDNTANAHVNLTMSGEVFIPESRVLLGLRAGYQHNFLLPTSNDAASVNAGGAVVQLRTGIRIF